MRAWLLAAVAVVAPASFAARITDVADAGDEKHPLEVDLEATYTHLRSLTTLTREQITAAAGTQLHEELKHVRTLDAIELRLAVGIWHDLELHAFAPLALRDQQSWNPASGTSTLSTNTISVSGCAAAGSCTTVQPILPIPGQSQRTGFGDPTVGITWGPINEERELRLRPELFPPGKPVSTWVVGFDWKFPLPGGKVNDPSIFGMASGGATPTGSESRKAHLLTLWTAFSKRYRVLEPFMALSASAPFAAPGAYDDCSHPELLSDVAPANCKGAWAGQTHYKPPFEAQLTLGAELVAAEDVKADARLSFEVRGDVRWHGPARDYTQVADALGKLTYADEYATTMGTLGVYGRVARWLHLRVYGSVGVDTAHFVTHEDIGADKDADGAVTVSGGNGQPAPDQNPLFDYRLDQVGRRLRAEPTVTWGFAGTLSLNF
jgi:hypothetical protein